MSYFYRKIHVIIQTRCSIICCSLPILNGGKQYSSRVLTLGDTLTFTCRELGVPWQPQSGYFISRSRFQAAAFRISCLHPTSQRTQRFSIIKASRLTLFMEMISVFCQKHMKQLSILCGAKLSVFSVISGFRHSINKNVMFLDLT